MIDKRRLSYDRQIGDFHMIDKSETFIWSTDLYNLSYSCLPFGICITELWVLHFIPQKTLFNQFYAKVNFNVGHWSDIFWSKRSKGYKMAPNSICQSVDHIKVSDLADCRSYESLRSVDHMKVSVVDHMKVSDLSIIWKSPICRSYESLRFVDHMKVSDLSILWKSTLDLKHLGALR